MTPEAIEKGGACRLGCRTAYRGRSEPQEADAAGKDHPRRALDLTQEEFATRYHIPLGTLRDWEQGRTEPDQPARAYLTLSASDPDRVNRLLNPKAH